MVEASVQRLADTRAHLQATKDEVRAGRSARQALHESAYARLRAKLESLPVIEQAKGIVMAQTGCGPDEAFELLRRASQRTNVRVRDLATDLVRQTASGKRGEQAG
jgi:AmiR/NasT family two-component response regulator